MATLVAGIQLLVAAAFASIPGSAITSAPPRSPPSRAELRRQDVRPEVLAENRIRFDASGHETADPGDRRRGDDRHRASPAPAWPRL
ncbi:hypothetical protein GCM10023322_23520 [Rugosimonospora acidiphila]|uniref:Uncharacterized protein n=1 Tax=Rugosimonospora acidiphila TaxID=556531 RepID=A0ABP9RQD8_9ACTN